MVRSRAHRPLEIVRGLFLLLLITALAGIVWLFFRGGEEAAPARPVDRRSPVGAVTGPEIVSVGEGFQYEVTEDGRKLFEIEAASVVSDRQERYVLEQVRLKVEREEGGFYGVESRRGTYELGTRGALLEGAVVLEGGDGLVLRGEAFELRQKGRVLVSTASPVRFTLPGGQGGRSEELWANLHRKLLVLSGGVVLEGGGDGEAPVELAAQRLAVNRLERSLRAEGEVVFRRGEDRLRARRLSAELSPDERGVRFVRGQWGVSGTVVGGEGAGVPSRLEFTGESFLLAYDAAGREPRRAELAGGEEPATLRWHDGTGRLRTLRSAKLLLDMVDGTVREIETPGAVTLDEALAGAPGRLLSRACGDALLAAFDGAGELRSLELEGAVSLARDGLSALADRLVGTGGGDRLELSGSPALLASGEAEITAPTIRQTDRGGATEASGGVRALFRGDAPVGFAVGEGGAGPVRVEAAEASWAGGASTAVFRGGVRAWQGDNFLLADQMSGAVESDRLEASGAVKTVWSSAAEPRGDGPDGASPGAPATPLEINAGRFEYRGGEGLMTYREAVRVQEGARRMECTALDVFLGAGRRMERLECSGAVVLDDPRTGRRIQATEAVYVPGDDRMRLLGEPVVLRDRDGAEIRGRRLLYDLETGEARILAEPRAGDRPDSETQDDNPRRDG